MSNIETAKLTRISILNWAKKLDLELTVETDVDNTLGPVTRIESTDDSFIFYFYDFRSIIIGNGGTATSVGTLPSGSKISDELIEIIKEQLN